MTESVREKRARGVRERIIALAYRQYATLLVEHERARRAAWKLDRRTPWDPAPTAWRTLRFLADVHDSARHATKALAAFFGKHGTAEEESRESEESSTSRAEVEEESRTRTSTRTRTIEDQEQRSGGGTTENGQAPDSPSSRLPHPDNRQPITKHRSVPPSVPLGAWRDALEAGIDLVADVVVAHGAELPWGLGKPRAPRKGEDFEAACRFLRDRDRQEDGLPSLALILDSADLAPVPPRRVKPDHRVTFYRGRQALAIDGVQMPLPYGREFELLEILAERRPHGEITPTSEHGTDWKNAVDRLRRRIQKATGAKLLPAVVLCRRGRAPGYRLAAGVRVRDD